MTELIVHPITERQLTAFTQRPGHALTLVGPAGSGKRSLALRLAGQLLGVEADKVVIQPYVRVIGSPDGKAIGVEVIRDLEHFMSLKVPSRADVRRVVIIEDAHLLTIEAQNAFLKTLEEPPEGTVFIMTSAHQQALLPTVRSRSAHVTVLRPDQAALKQFFGDNGDVNQALLVSGGLPGLMTAMLGEEEHPLQTATAMARELLAKTSFERLAKVDELAKNRPLAMNTLFIMQQMAHISLQSATGPGAKKWRNVLTVCYEAQELLLQSAQPKLVLTDLMLNL